MELWRVEVKMRVMLRVGLRVSPTCRVEELAGASSSSAPGPPKCVSVMTFLVLAALAAARATAMDCSGGESVAVA